MKLKSQIRLAPALFDSATIDKEKRTVDLAFSSETPVERYFGSEVLAHDKGSVRLARFNDGANLLFNHNMDDVVGVIEPGSARIDKDRVGRATVRFAKTARGDEVMGLVDDQILRKTSVRYQIHKIEERVKTNEVRVTDWEPLELSIVTIPADASVGVGRAAHDEEIEVEVVKTETSDPAADAANNPPAKTAEIRSITMTTDVKDPPAQAEGKQSTEQLEASRKQAIINLCRANKLDERFERNWIANGTSLEVVSDEILKVMVERGKVTEAAPSFLGMEQKDVKNWSLFRAVNAIVSGNWEKAGLELAASKAVQDKTGKAPENARGILVPLDVLVRQMPMEAIRQAMQRDLTAAVPSAGGYLVSTENRGFVDVLRNASVCYAMGATRLAGLQGNIQIPKRTAGATGYWLATEGSPITESGQTFGQIAMTPKTCGAYNEVSRQLLLQSDPSVEGLVMSGLALDVGTAVDLAGISGSGNAGQPLGLTNTANIGSVTGTSIDYAKIVEFQTDVATANALDGNLGYVTTPAVAGLLKARVKYANTASPIWEGRLGRGQVDGYPAMSSNQMASATMIYGDWSQMVIGEWGVLEVAVNQQANFQAAIIGIRALYSVDIAIRIPTAFSQATSIT